MMYEMTANVRSVCRLMASNVKIVRYSLSQFEHGYLKTGQDFIRYYQVGENLYLHGYSEYIYRQEASAWYSSTNTSVNLKLMKFCFKKNWRIPSIMITYTGVIFKKGPYGDVLYCGKTFPSRIERYEKRVTVGSFGDLRTKMSTNPNKDGFCFCLEHLDSKIWADIQIETHKYHIPFLSVLEILKWFLLKYIWVLYKDCKGLKNLMVLEEHRESLLAEIGKVL